MMKSLGLTLIFLMSFTATALAQSDDKALFTKARDLFAKK